MEKGLGESSQIHFLYDHPLSGGGECTNFFFFWRCNVKDFKSTSS